MTDTDRQRRWRARRRGDLAPVPRCEECGARILGSLLSPHAGSGLCSPCWRDTEEGRAWDSARHGRHYAIARRDGAWILFRVRPWTELMTFESRKEAQSELNRLLTNDETTLD